MSIEQDWEDLARGMAARKYNEAITAKALGNEFAALAEQFGYPTAVAFIEMFKKMLVEAFVAGFLAAKHRDVVTVDPYKVDPEG